MSYSSQGKYVPPHRRNRSLVEHNNGQLSSTSDISPPEHFSTIEKELFKRSPILRRLLAAKQQFGSDPLIEQRFQTNRKLSVAAVPGDTLNTTFRDQFETAMGEINEQVNNTLVAPRDGSEGGFRTFLDLGCAPGGFSKWILEHNPEARGLGVTLSAEEHGLGFSFEDWEESARSRYDVHNADLTTCIDTTINHFGERSCDLVVAGAVYRDEYTMKKKPDEGADLASPTRLRHVLSLSQLTVALRGLRPGGTLIMVASLKPFPLNLTILLLLRTLFGRLTATKGKRLHLIRSSYYLVCQELRADQVDSELLQRLEAAMSHLRKAETVEASWNGMVPESGHGGEGTLSEDDLKYVCSHLEPMWEKQVLALERGIGQARGSYRL